MLMHCRFNEDNFVVAAEHAGFEMVMPNTIAPRMPLFGESWQEADGSVRRTFKARVMLVQVARFTERVETCHER